MDLNQFKRIAIVGVPGSGKSTLAHRLGKKLNLPVHHLDTYVFHKNGDKKDHAQFYKEHEALLNQESWIIEGCSIKTFEPRAARADLIIILDFPRWKSFYRLLKRCLFWHKQPEGSGSIRRPNFILIKYIWNFRNDQMKKIKAAAKDKKHVLVFKSKKQLNLNNALA